VKRFVILRGREIVAVHLASEEQAQAYAASGGQPPWVESAEDVRPDTHYHDGNSFIAYTGEQAAAKANRPNHATEWSNIEFRWIDGRESGEQSRVAAAEARCRRDALLRASDWTQLADVLLAANARAAWAAYRAALRQVPAQGGFPHSIDWPASP
jgi:phosphoribosyl-AMP cyclohydrolase